jgi:hypothetical protein
MVQFRFDPDNPPTLTEEQLQASRDLRDEDIDLSDIPDQSHRTGWRRVFDLEQIQNWYTRCNGCQIGFFLIKKSCPAAWPLGTANLNLL